MNASIPSARDHPAAVACLAIAGIALTACALVAIAYMLGWIPRIAMPGARADLAMAAQPAVKNAADVALLPGETLVSPADAPAVVPAAAPAQPAARPAIAQPPTFDAKSAPAPEPAKALRARKAPPVPAQAAPAYPAYEQALAQRAAPSRPNYTRSELAPYTSYERSTETVCVNCGIVASIDSAGFDWRVRVRFEDGTTGMVRYGERPRLRVGERVHVEDGRILPD